VDAGVKRKVTDSNNVLLVSMCLAALDNSHDWLASSFACQPAAARADKQQDATSQPSQASNGKVVATSNTDISKDTIACNALACNALACNALACHALETKGESNLAAYWS
jgi:hypothetical protein